MEHTNKKCHTKWCNNNTPYRYGRSKKFCSLECRASNFAYNTSKSKTCQNCNNLFHRSKSVSTEAWERQIFCSARCAGSKDKFDSSGGMSQSEVAAVLGVTVKAIQQIEYRALRKLREENAHMAEYLR